jgi:Uma2 family endonuclease
VSLPQLKQPGYTLEDWKSWEGRWELMKGVAYDMTPAPSTEHQEIVFGLARELADALDEAKQKTGGGTCQVWVSPVDVFLSHSEVVQPDLCVVCDPSKVLPLGIEGAPDLVVEVLSPSTAGKDWTWKRWTYERAGVPEYLIVDPGARVSVLLRLNAGRYEESAHVEWGAILSLFGGNLSVTLG